MSGGRGLEKIITEKPLLTRNNIFVSVFLDILWGKSSGLWRAGDHWDRLTTSKISEHGWLE